MRAWLGCGVVLLGLFSGCGGVSIAPVVMDGSAATREGPTNDDLAFERQLAGHLRRVEGCFVSAQGRTPMVSGLVEVSYRVEPTGHVGDVSVGRNTSGDAQLEGCVRSRLTSLYFDPAPTQTRERLHHFVFCGADDGPSCALGPATRVDAGEAGEAPHREAVEDLFRGRSAAIDACQEATDPAASAIVEVEVTIGVDGRVMTGRVMNTLPAASPVSNCALRPLLGTQVTVDPPAEPARYRRTLLLRPTSQPPEERLTSR